MKIFTVILNWNGADDTVDCLDSVNKIDTDNNDLSVLVIDNASTDDSVKTLGKYKFTNGSYEVIENENNLGYAEGNNVGIRHALEAGADYVMILNNDTEVDKDFLIYLLQVAKAKKDGGIFCPKIYFAKGFEYHKDRYKKSDLGKVIWWAGGSVNWKSIETKHVGLDEVDKGQFSTTKKVENANGTCMLIKSAVFEKVGYLDPRYYLYWEETDFSQRLQEKGYEIYFVPQAHVYHKVSKSSKIGGGLHDYFLVRNRLLFASLYAPIRSKLTMIKWGLGVLFFGRKWQRIGVRDFFLGIYGKGSWKNESN